jgi:hypothetical protein
MSVTPNNGLPLLPENTLLQYLVFNELALRLDALLQLSVLDRGLNTPPGSPADGARYIVGTSPTGAWVGQENAVAVWVVADAAWTFLAPAEGWRAYVVDEEADYVFDGAAWALISSGGGGAVDSVNGDTGAVIVPVPIGIACSDETTALTAGTAKVTFRMPFAMTLTAVRANVKTAPTGSVLTVDINEGGSSILSTKLTIDAGETTSTTAATPAVISDTSLADDAQITIDIDAVGSAVAGAGLKVWLIGYPS